MVEEWLWGGLEGVRVCSKYGYDLWWKWGNIGKYDGGEGEKGSKWDRRKSLCGFYDDEYIRSWMCVLVCCAMFVE